MKTVPLRVAEGDRFSSAKAFAFADEKVSARGRRDFFALSPAGGNLSVKRFAFATSPFRGGKGLFSFFCLVLLLL